MAVYYKARRPVSQYPGHHQYIAVPLTSFAKDQTSTGTATRPRGECDDRIRTHGAEV
jgi:hypothetical protein